MSIRAYVAEDGPGVRALGHSIFPEYAGDAPWEPGWQFESPEKCAAKYVATDGSGGIIGYASARHVGVQHYRGNLMVHAAHRCAGVGGALLQRLGEQLAGPLNGEYLQVRVRSDQQQAISFMKRNGFEYIHEMGSRILDLSTIEQSWIDALVGRYTRDGVTICRWSELTSRMPDIVEQLVGVYQQTLAEWPNPDPYMASDPQESVRYITERIAALPRTASFLVALVAGKPVGFNGGRDNGIGLGVHPDYRRRGIAAALTAVEIADLKRQGAGIFFSCSANPAMHRIYDRLGCQTWFSELRFVKRI